MIICFGSAFLNALANNMFFNAEYNVTEGLAYFIMPTYLGLNTGEIQLNWQTPTASILCNECIIQPNHCT